MRLVTAGPFLWPSVNSRCEQSGFARLVDHVGDEGSARADHEQGVGFIHRRRTGFKQRVANALFVARVSVERKKSLLHCPVYGGGLLKLGKGLRQVRARL